MATATTRTTKRGVRTAKRNVRTSNARAKTSARRSRVENTNDDDADENEERKGMFSITRGTRKTDPYLKILIYGEYGAGKTTLAASAVDVPSMRDVLFVNSERGTVSIDKAVNEDGHAIIEHTDDIDFMTIASYPEFAKVHKFLLSHCRARDDGDDELTDDINERMFGSSAKGRRYKTVIVDSLSDIDNSNFNRLLGVNTADLMRDPQKAEWNDYQRNATAMTSILSEFRKLPMNVIMVAPSEVREEKQKRVSSTYPVLVGSSREKVKGYFDIVGYLEEIDPTVEDNDDDDVGRRKKRKSKKLEFHKIERRLWLRKRDGVYAKSRITPDNLPFLDNVTLSDLYKYAV